MNAPPPYPSPPNAGPAWRDDAFEAALTWHVLRRRVVAGLIDLLLCAIAIGVFVLFAVVLGVLTLGLGFGLLALIPAVPVLYNWLFVAWMSATPGQRVMGLALRRNDTLAHPAPVEALVWSLGFALTLTLTLGLLWLLVVLLTERKRALHDIVAGLVVVRAATLTGPPPSWNMPSGGHPAP